MIFSISGNRCEELKTTMATLEHEIDDAIRLVNDIKNQDWEVLRKFELKGESRLLQPLKELGEKLSLYSSRELDQVWIAEGVAKFSTIIRENQNNVGILSENVLRETIKSIGANQGAIFIYNEREGAEGVLEMTAIYAYGRKKHQFSEIHPGQGLVGQCYLEGGRIYMTQVPKDYVNITSGLGEATPRCILIAPLKLNDQIIGVMEIASFTPLTPVQLLFIEKISENVAGAIVAVKETERTRKLLKQSEMMTEELKNREEELQQNLEELRAIQEDQLRKQKALEKANIEIQEKKLEIERIQERESALIESKLKTQQELADRVISKLKSKIQELEKKAELINQIEISSYSN